MHLVTEGDGDAARLPLHHMHALVHGDGSGKDWLSWVELPLHEEICCRPEVGLVIWLSHLDGSVDLIRYRFFAVKAYESIQFAPSVLQICRSGFMNLCMLSDLSSWCPRQARFIARMATRCARKRRISDVQPLGVCSLGLVCAVGNALRLWRWLG